VRLHRPGREPEYPAEGQPRPRPLDLGPGRLPGAKPCGAAVRQGQAVPPDRHPVREAQGDLPRPAPSDPRLHPPKTADQRQHHLEAYGKDSFLETSPHRPILGKVVPTFFCPADGRAAAPWDFEVFQVAFTNYLGVEGTDQMLKDGLLYLDSRTRISD